LNSDRGWWRAVMHVLRNMKTRGKDEGGNSRGFTYYNLLINRMSARQSVQMPFTYVVSS
jgi:hypothetical protein